MDFFAGLLTVFTHIPVHSPRTSLQDFISSKGADSGRTRGICEELSRSSYRFLSGTNGAPFQSKYPPTCSSVEESPHTNPK